MEYLKMINSNKERAASLILLIAMIVFFFLFVFYRIFYDQTYREKKCAEKASDEIKNLYQGTGFEPENDVYEMFYSDCLRDAGWIK